MNDKFDDDDFEVIPSDAIERSARGRKASPEAVKVAGVLSTLKPGQTVVLKSMKVDLNAKDAVKARARVSAIIRSGARTAAVSVKIAFRPSDGAPQVTVVK